MVHLKAALVGVGYWGKILFPILKDLESIRSFELRSICDHHVENLSTCRALSPSVTCYTDVGELLASEHIDVVFIATQPSTHAALAAKFLKRNCHVFLEKPFVHDPKEAEIIIKLAEDRGLKLMVGHRLLYSPAVAWVKKHLEPIPAGSELRASWKRWGIHQPGGVRWDLASHYLAVFQYLLGSPTAITSVLITRQSAGNPEEMSITLAYPHERQATIDVSWNQPTKLREFSIKTPHQLIYINHDHAFPLTLYDVPKQLKANETRPLGGDSFHPVGGDSFHPGPLGGDSFHPASGWTKHPIKATASFDLVAMPEGMGLERQFMNFFDAISNQEPILSNALLARKVVSTLANVDQIIAKTATGRH